MLKKKFSNKLYKNSIAIMLNYVCNALAGFIFWAAAANLLTAKDIGMSILIISIATFITTISNIGLDAGLIRFLPSIEDKSDLYGTVIVISIILSTVNFVLTIFIITLLNIELYIDIYNIILILGYIIVNITCSIQNVTMIAIRRGDLSLIHNLSNSARIPILVAFSFLGQISIILSLFLSSLLMFALGQVILGRGNIRFIRKLNIRSYKNILVYSLGNYMQNLSLFLPLTLIPFLVTQMLGTNFCAYFYISYFLAGVLLMVPVAISTSLFVEGSYDIPLKNNVAISVVLSFSILIPLIIFIYLFGDRILLLFNVEYYKNSFELLKLLSLSSVISILFNIYLSINRIKKSIKKVTILNFMLSFSIISLIILLLPVYGLDAIGYSWIISYIIMSVIIIIIIFNDVWLSPIKRSPA